MTKKKKAAPKSTGNSQFRPRGYKEKRLGPCRVSKHSAGVGELEWTEYYWPELNIMEYHFADRVFTNWDNVMKYLDKNL